MKKRCTNSACRRVFTFRQDMEVICPYCGKKYPRMMSCSRYQLVYTGLVERGCKIEAIKLLRRLVPDMTFGEINTLVEHPPAVVLDGLTAAQLKALEPQLNPNVCTFQIRAAGIKERRPEHRRLTYRVVLVDFDRRQEKKLVRLVQEFFRCSMRKAKARLHRPTSMTVAGVSRSEAEEIQRRLENAGGKAVVERIMLHDVEEEFRIVR